MVGSFAKAAAVVLAAAGFLACARTAWAIGDETTRRQDDVVLTVNSKWAGNGNGGYYPVRIRVVNKGKSRNLTFRLAGSYEKLPEVEQSVGAEQNATVRFTLLMPMVSEAGNATLRVYSDGRELEDLSQSIELPEVPYETSDHPALVVISPTNVDCDRFEDGVAAVLTAPTSGYGASSDHEVVGTVLLPEAWLGYSGVDFVAISLKALESLSAEHRSALLKWVDCGGNLIVYEVGEQASELERILEFSKRSFAGTGWEVSDPGRRRTEILPDSEGGRPVAVADHESSQTGEVQGQDVWSVSADTFVRRDMMLGQVYAFRDNPFPGTIHDWGWFLRTADPMRYQWSSRHGVSGRRPHDEFLAFLIPGIDSVPVYAFLVLITLFTVVIGPLNYLFFWKRKQLYMLVLTIPAIALVTSLSLFLYSAVSHGFGTKSRTRSITYLDQRNNTAVTQARIALWAGLAPSGGLQFSPETAVIPVWNSDSQFQAGRVNWSQTQSLTSGWLRSRTRTQFATISHRIERARLEVRSSSGGKLSVANGLEWGIEKLLIADADGTLFYGEDVPAGGSAVLSKPSDGDLESLKAFLSESKPAMPDGVSAIETYDSFSPYGYYGGRDHHSSHFAKSLMEQNIQVVTRKKSQLTPNSYYAVLKQNPGVELGLENTTPKAELHVLIGHY